jgi:hypothetical protein
MELVLPSYLEFHKSWLLYTSGCWLGIVLSFGVMALILELFHFEGITQSKESV